MNWRTFLNASSFGVAALALGIAGPGCLRLTEPAERSPSDSASAWFELLYDIVKAERTSPPRAARIYGIAAVALYESIAIGSTTNRSLVGQLNELTFVPRSDNEDYYWPAVASSAMSAAVQDLYPAGAQSTRDAIDALEQRLAGEHAMAVSRDTFERSRKFGKAVAGAILDWSRGDGSSAIAGTSARPVFPGSWEPTPPQFVASPLEPGWGALRTMVEATGAEPGPAGHPTYSTDPGSGFYAAANEVYRVGRSLTDEQRTIADYWADNAVATGTPPGHWIAIVSQIAQSDRLSLAVAAQAYARVGIAVHDAFICCWKTKYATNLLRPVTYILRNIDADWQPQLVTPSFPSYISGHATQSEAAAVVLTDLFGSRGFSDTTHIDHGLSPGQKPREFASFGAASAEAALSRLYGGIHYGFDNRDGQASGRRIGQVILDNVSFGPNWKATTR